MTTREKWHQRRKRLQQLRIQKYNRKLLVSITVRKGETVLYIPRAIRTSLSIHSTINDQLCCEETFKTIQNFEGILLGE